MRIVTFLGPIESFNYFTGELSQAFTAMGHQVFLMDINDPGAFPGLSDFIREGPPDIVLSFDRIGLHTPDYIALWDSLGALCVNLFMDPPFRFHTLLEKPPKRMLMFCPDELHVKYLKEWYPLAGEAYFLPHPATPAVGGPYPGRGEIPRPDTEKMSPADQVDQEKGLVNEWENRPYPLLFPGSYYTPETRLEALVESAGDPLFARLYREMFERMLAEPETDIVAMTVRTAKDYSLPEEPAFLQRLFSTLEPLDWAVRMENRRRALQAIAEAGIPLYLLGRGFDALPFAEKSNIFLLGDRIPFSDTFSFMEKAKLVLNVMPGFKAGSHDRIFNTLLRGALPLTDRSSFLNTVFQDGESIAFYSLGQESGLPGRIEELLKVPEDTVSMIRNGAEIVGRRFTWGEYARQILEKCAGAV